MKLRANHLSNLNPLETHPYIEDNPIVLSRRSLIIGTMPPKENQFFKFFYSNTSDFWLHSIGETFLHSKNDCLRWLDEKNATISDIIYSCQRKILGDPSDKNIFNIQANENLIRAILSNDSKIKNIVFTSGKLNFSIRNEKIDVDKTISAFSLFCRALQDLGKKVEFAWYNASNFISIEEAIKNVSFKDKALFKAKIDGKEFNVICLPSPSGQASRTMKFHPFCIGWGNTEKGWTNKFRKSVYSLTFNENFEELNKFQNFNKI